MFSLNKELGFFNETLKFIYKRHADTISPLISKLLNELF